MQANLLQEVSHARIHAQAQIWVRKHAITQLKMLSCFVLEVPEPGDSDKGLPPQVTTCRTARLIALLSGHARDSPRVISQRPKLGFIRPFDPNSEHTDCRVHYNHVKPKKGGPQARKYYLRELVQAELVAWRGTS